MQRRERGKVSPPPWNFAVIGYLTGAGLQQSKILFPLQKFLIRNEKKYWNDWNDWNDPFQKNV